jgi:phosphatidylglycerol:prolipoprotein diacylglycerol transferase
MYTVEFPGLGGLKLDINPVAFTVFGRPILWYGILISLAFFIAVYLASRQSKAFGISQDDFLDMILFAGPIGIIGARIYYVIFSWDYYKDDLLGVFKIWEGGLAVYGGIIAGVITAYIFTRVRKINTWKFFDFAVVYIPLAQAIGRWGNFFNQEAFGTNTTLPWGMTSQGTVSYLQGLVDKGVKVDPNMPVHPTFLYESIWNLIVFFVLMNRRKHKKADGEVFLLYLALYGVGRFFIEGLRTDSLMLGNLRVSQLLSALFFVAAVILLVALRQRATKISFEDVELGTSEYGNVLKTVEEENKALEAEEQATETEESTTKTEEEAPLEEAADNTEDDETNNSEEIESSETDNTVENEHEK